MPPRMKPWDPLVAAAAVFALATTAGARRVGPIHPAPHRAYGAVDDARMLSAGSHPNDWVVNGGTFDGTYYSTLDQINLDTVSQLGPAWSIDYDTTRGQEAAPLEVDGV